MSETPKKRITIRSAKNKGATCQKAARDMALRMCPDLEPDDIRSAIMGSSGTDLVLSPAAQKAFPFSVECKAKATGFTPVYAALEQADRGTDLTPLAYLKQDRKRHLVVLYADDFEALWQRSNGDRV